MLQIFWRKTVETDINFGFCPILHSCAAEVTAEEVSGLYSGLVFVADQSEQSRKLGVRDALAQVLIKLTGNSNIMQVPGIQQAVTNTDNYVAGVGYKEFS